MGTITGDLASQVFRMIRDGLSFPEVVIKTEETPDTIRALWRDYYKRPPVGEDEEEEPPFVDDSSDYERRIRKLDADIMERRRRREER
jgi:hypothetical protein